MVLDLLAQRVDVPLETIEGPCLLTPDAVERLVMAYHTMVVLAEISKEPELGGREGAGFAPNAYLVGLEIKGQDLVGICR